MPQLRKKAGCREDYLRAVPKGEARAIREKERMRKFASGAIRDSETAKVDYHGSLSPLVLKRFAQYMREQRNMPDGSERYEGNWKKGFPRDTYIRSMFRHFMDVVHLHDGFQSDTDIETALCAVLFNVQGLLHEVLLKRSS